MPKKMTIYRRPIGGVSEEAEMYASFAEDAVRRHPKEWSKAPWPAESLISEPASRSVDPVVGQGPEPEPEREDDDLTRIKGIGPVTAAKLNEHGIVNFDQLANLDVAKANEIDVEAADLANWSEQARAFLEEEEDGEEED